MLQSENGPPTMTPEVEEQFKDGLRALLEERGYPILADRSRPGERDVNVYAPRDSSAKAHVADWADRPCGWVIGAGVGITEHSISTFVDTLSENRESIGIEAFPISCRCGEFTEVTLRVDGSLGGIMRALLGQDYPIVTL